MSQAEAAPLALHAEPRARGGAALRVTVGAALVAVVLAWVHWGLASASPSTAAAPTALHAITVHAGGTTTLTRDVLDAVRELDGVTGVFPRATASIRAAGLGDGDAGAALHARSYDPTVSPADVEPARGEIVLPATLAGADLSARVGTTVDVEYGADATTTSRTVAAVYPPGPSSASTPTAVASFDDVAAWQAARLGLTADGMLQSLGADGMTVLAASADDAHDVLRGLRDLGVTTARAVEPAGRAATAALAGVPVAPAMVVVVLLALTALAFGALAARTRELGVAVVVGSLVGVVLVTLHVARGTDPGPVALGRLALAVALTGATSVVSGRVGSALVARTALAEPARTG